MARSYVLGSHFEAFVEGQVKSGRYSSASEVLRESLRLLEDQEFRRQSRRGGVASLPPLARKGERAPDDVEVKLAHLEARWQQRVANGD